MKKENIEKNESRNSSRDRNFSNRIPIAKTVKDKISNIKDSEFYDGIVKILRKAKPGPVVFSMTDGYGTVDAVIKDSTYETGDVVHITGDVIERSGRLQVEIKTINKAEKNFDDIIAERSQPVRTTFSINSERYEKMKPTFVEIARRLRKAIIEGQPIMIRHHNDSDGITSGLAIEMSCIGFMKSIGVDPDYNLYRSPSKAPFYELTDVYRDLVLSNRIMSHGQKKPLIIVLDNGSTPEDAAGFKILKTLGYDSIVVDHHNPVIMNNGKTSVCPLLELHLNPYMFGFDSQTSAGMLCYELGRFIDENFEHKNMPAVAAVSDRCTIPEAEAYIKNSGLTKEELASIGVAIDYSAYHLKFDSGEGVFELLYDNKALVELLNSEVKKGVETQLQSTLPYLRTQDINGITFSNIDLEKYTLRFTYPTPGKVLGMIHDHVASHRENSPVMTIGYVSDMIIIRATHPVLPVHAIIERLRKQMPEANVDGGGHEMAGTIKFVPAHLTTIIEFIKEELKKVNIADVIGEN